MGKGEELTGSRLLRDLPVAPSSQPRSRAGESFGADWNRHPIPNPPNDRGVRAQRPPPPGAGGGALMGDWILRMGAADLLISISSRSSGAAVRGAGPPLRGGALRMVGGTPDSWAVPPKPALSSARKLRFRGCGRYSHPTLHWGLEPPSNAQLWALYAPNLTVGLESPPSVQLWARFGPEEADRIRAQRISHVRGAVQPCAGSRPVEGRAPATILDAEIREARSRGDPRCSPHSPRSRPRG
jgi:hypothetical protein